MADRSDLSILRRFPTEAMPVRVRQMTFGPKCSNWQQTQLSLCDDALNVNDALKEGARKDATSSAIWV